MSVSLKPSSSLGFNRPLTQLVKRVLTVTNNNDQPVAFKVKTTAPKLYCVRPNSGRIEPGESVDVQVLLQAMKEDPPVNAKCKDKFLVQSTIITPLKEAMPLGELWNNVDGEEPKVHQQKIKVVYLPPVGQELPEEDEGPSSFMDNSGRYDTVRENLDRQANGHPDLGVLQEPQAPVERAFSPAVHDYSVAEEAAHWEEPSPAVPAARHAAPAPSAAPPVTSAPAPQSADEELRAQLVAAQAEISRLRFLLESVPEPGTDDRLRRRRAQSDKSDSATMVSDRTDTDMDTVSDGHTIQQDGISPQVAGLIAFMVFVLTYLFF